MQKKSIFVANLLKVVISNIIVLLSGVLASFVIPKLMGVTQYGYYRIFMLYAVYASLLHFGFVDGILLHFGGLSYDNLNKKSIRSLSTFFITFEFIIGLIIILSSFLIANPIYHYICLDLGIYTIAINIVTYFQYLTQAVMNFSLLARMNSIQPILTIIIIVSAILCVHLRLFGQLTYQLYLTLYVSTFIIVMIIYVLKYHDIIFGARIHRAEITSQIKLLFKVGFMITISYQIGALIFNLDNQYILFLFSTDTFSNYSFAYSLIQILTTIINAISTVIFPYLNRQKEDQVTKSYDINTSYMLIFIFLSLLAYYPIDLFIHYYLPNYYESLKFFRILLPGVAISNCIYSIIFNYYKVLRKIKEYLYFGIGILLTALILNYLAYLITRSAYGIAISSLLTLLLWYLVTNYYLVRVYKVKSLYNTIYIILMLSAFEIITPLNNKIVSAFLYLTIYVLATIVTQRETLPQLIRGKKQ